MATIKLTKVNIGENVYLHKFKRDSTGEIVSVVTTKTEYDNITSSTPPTQTGFTWISSCATIGFNTLSKKLSDNQYATQANGFHWVKIPGYKMYKINPEFISRNILSQAGITFIQTNSVIE